MLTNAGAPIEQVGSIVMETTSAFAVVPAGQVDTSWVVVALDKALCTLVDIWGRTDTHTHTHQDGSWLFSNATTINLKLKLIMSLLPALWSVLVAAEEADPIRANGRRGVGGAKAAAAAKQQGSKSARNHTICQWTCFLPLHLLSCCRSVHFVCGMQHAHTCPDQRRSVAAPSRKSKSLSLSLSHPLWMVWALLLMCSSLAPGCRSRPVRTPRWLRHDLQSYLHMHKCKPQHTSAGSDWLLVNLKYEYNWRHRQKKTTWCYLMRNDKRREFFKARYV